MPCCRCVNRAHLFRKGLWFCWAHFHENRRRAEVMEQRRELMRDRVEALHWARDRVSYS